MWLRRNISNITFRGVRSYSQRSNKFRLNISWIQFETIIGKRQGTGSFALIELFRVTDGHGEFVLIDFIRSMTSRMLFAAFGDRSMIDPMDDRRMIVLFERSRGRSFSPVVHWCRGCKRLLRPTSSQRIRHQDHKNERQNNRNQNSTRETTRLEQKNRI